MKVKDIINTIMVKLNIRPVRRCSQAEQQDIVEEVKQDIIEEVKQDIIEEVKQEPIKYKLMYIEEVKQEPIKYKLMYIEILFRDGTSTRYSQKYKEGSTDSYVKCYYDFYNWFFNRVNSQWYVFNHTNGAEIFKREDIKRVKFNNRIEAEKVA